MRMLRAMIRKRDGRASTGWSSLGGGQLYRKDPLGGSKYVFVLCVFGHVEAILEARDAIVHILDVFFGSWNPPEHQPDRTQGTRGATRAK